MGRASPELLDPVRYRFAHALQTRFSDMDVNRHINNVAMAAAFEDARVRFDEACGIRPLYAHLRTMIAAANIDYLAEAHYPASLVVHCAVLAIGRTSWTLGQLAVQDGRARGYCRAIIVATDGMAPTPLPNDLRTGLAGNMIAG